MILAASYQASSREPKVSSDERWRPASTSMHSWRSAFSASFQCRGSRGFCQRRFVTGSAPRSARSSQYPLRPLTSRSVPLIRADLGRCKGQTEGHVAAGGPPEDKTPGHRSALGRIRTYAPASGGRCSIP
jgi:hypothetical protein